MANVKANENVDVLAAQAALTSAALITASQTLTADHIGKRISVSMAAAGGVIKMKRASTCEPDSVVWIVNVGAKRFTLGVDDNSGDVLALSALNAGEAAMLDTDGVHTWRVLIRGRTTADNEVINANLSVGGALAVSGESTLSGNVMLGGNVAVGGNIGVSGNVALGSGKRVSGEFSGGPTDALFQNSGANKVTLVGAMPSGTGNLAGWLGWSADLSKWAGVYYDGGSSSGAFAVSNVEWRLIQNSVTKARVALDGSYYYGFAASNGLSNGNLVAGNVGPNANGLGISPDGAYLAIMNTANAGNLYLSKGPSAGNSQYVQFSNAGGAIGSITALSGFTGVAYNTTSDYRLKDGLAPMTGALASVRKAKLYTGYFKSDPLRIRQDMVLAHEISEIVAAAVSGQKDAVEHVPTYRDGYDPNNVQPDDILSIEQVIVPQQVDHSRLVLRLWGAVQELADEFDAACARVKRLEERQ
ncbi:hypothetical protein WJ55_23660 [Burkholderia ubonensis]|nr:hypothetical protein WJ55_23660 [Burkholderia ubonensis]